MAKPKDIPIIGRNDLKSIKNRLGRVLIDYEMLLHIDLVIIEKIFGSFFPIKGENNFTNGIIEYYGYSKHFDVLDNGVPPTYRLKINTLLKEFEFVKIGVREKS